ncbi:MAG: class I SAM-dependent methyltransferase [Nitrospinaceae bacterium]
MTCPLCNSKSDFLLTGEGREYWLCRCCALIAVPKKFFLSREEEKNRYLQHNNSLENEGYVNMFQNKIDVIKTLCPGIKTVLDYGCGYAPVLKTLLRGEGFAVEAYDPLFFPDGISQSEFDLIISTETFEHFKDPGKEVSSLVSRLAPKGFLAVMTRFYPHGEGGSAGQNFHSWYYKRDPTHIAFYRQETFSWIARTFGLRVVHDNQIDFIVLQLNRGN